MSELQLFDIPAAPKVTDRQQRALDAITAAGWDGLTTDEIGQVLHADKHDVRDICAFCGSAGNEVGAALRAKGLVERRRRQAPGRDIYMVWVAAGTPTRRPVEREYGLPEGY